MVLTTEQRKLVEENLGLVYDQAKTYCFQGVSMEDLVQEGILGLARAVIRYDPKKGKISTMAVPWIRQAMSNKGPKLQRTIRIPQHVHQKVQAFYKQAEIHGYKKTRELSGEKIEEYIQHTKPTGTLDKIIEEDGFTLFSIIQSDEDTEEEMTKRIIAEEIMDYVNRLPPKEAYVIKERYNLGTKITTLKSRVKIAKVLGVSPERVRQLENSALKRLRGIMKEYH